MARLFCHFFVSSRESGDNKPHFCVTLNIHCCLGKKTSLKKSKRHIAHPTILVYLLYWNPKMAPAYQLNELKSKGTRRGRFHIASTILNCVVFSFFNAETDTNWVYLLPSDGAVLQSAGRYLKTKIYFVLVRQKSFDTCVLKTNYKVRKTYFPATLKGFLGKHPSNRKISFCTEKNVHLDLS